MSLLRFLMLLALVMWLGGIIFFASVVAPTLFKVLPTHELAGAVVTRSLAMLHGIGIACGIIFAVSSMIYEYATRGMAHPLAARHLLIYIMLLLTVVSQFAVSPKMAALRADMGQIDLIPAQDARRIRFNQLHQWSTRLESGVLLFGLITLYLVARRIS